MNKYREFTAVKQLPPIPKTIKPLPCEDDPENLPKAVVIAGLSLVGERGYVCRTVSILGGIDQESGVLFGWSLCLGNPDQPDEEPYHFRTSDSDQAGTARGTEIPNTMVYFEAEVDAELATEEADQQKLEKVIAYVLPYISDVGPPPSDGKSFNELVEEMSTSSPEL